MRRRVGDLLCRVHVVDVEVRADQPPSQVFRERIEFERALC